MKTIITILLMSYGSITFAHDDTRYQGLTKEEISLVKSIERNQEETLIRVDRVEDERLLLTFGSIKYLINHAGFVETVWILGDDDITWEEN